MERKAIIQKRAQADRRARRVRAKIHGTADCPRLSVFRSLKHVSAQLIDDDAGRTLVAAHDFELKGKAMERAKEVGGRLAKEAKSKGITKVIFDRGPYLYHGQVKILAEAAREGGLVF